MKKNLVFLSALLLSCATAQAKWFVGGSVSNNYANTSMTSYINANGGSTFTLHQMRGNGIAAGILAGYMHSFNNFCLGGEIGADWGSSKAKTDGNVITDSSTTPATKINDNVTLGITKKDSYYVAALLGLKTSGPITPYIKLGLHATGFTFHYSSPDDNEEGNQNKRILGIAPGAGVNWKISNCFSVRGEYSYHLYQTAKTRNLNANSGAEFVYLKASPRVHSVKASLVFSF